MRLLIRGVWLGLLAGLVAAPRANAHEEGVLKLSSRELPRGDSVTVTGEKFSKGGVMELVLVGVSGRHLLRKVRADSAGTFSTRLQIPGLDVGAYRLVAVASDGDEVAGLDVTVVHSAAADHATLDAPPEPTVPVAEPLDLERAQSLAVNLAVIVTAALALIIGVMLVREGAAPTDRFPLS